MHAPFWVRSTSLKCWPLTPAKIVSGDTSTGLASHNVIAASNKMAAPQAMHEPLLSRALRPSGLLPPSVTGVALEVRHAAFTEAADVFAALIPSLV